MSKQKISPRVTNWLAVGLIAAIAIPSALFAARGDADARADVRAEARVEVNAGTSTCIRAFGHLISFGWLRDNDSPTVGDNCRLPNGIARILDRDEVAPVISNTVIVAGSSTASVRWMSDEPASSKVYYSTVNGFELDATSTRVVSSSTLVTDHELELLDLATDTRYYLKIESEDAAGNATMSSQFNFLTSM